MVSMIHLIQLGIIHRDNVQNRAEPSCQVVNTGTKLPAYVTYLSCCWSLHRQDVFLMRVHSFHSDPLQSWVTTGGKVLLFNTQLFRLFIFNFSARIKCVCGVSSSPYLKCFFLTIYSHVKFDRYTNQNRIRKVCRTTAVPSHLLHSRCFVKKTQY